MKIFTQHPWIALVTNHIDTSCLTSGSSRVVCVSSWYAFTILKHKICLFMSNIESDNFSFIKGVFIYMLVESCILRTQIRYINNLTLDNILKLNLPKRILEQTLWISLWKMCKYYFSSSNVLREITFYKNNGFSRRKIKFKDLNIHA